MIMIVDEDRRIQTFNRAVLEFTGMTPRQVIGLRCGLAFNCGNSKEDGRGCGFGSNCNDCRLWGAIRKTIETGEKCLRVEAVIPIPEEKGGGKMTLMVSTAPIRTYGKDLALVFLEDFTKFRKERTVEID